MLLLLQWKAKKKLAFCEVKCCHCVIPCVMIIVTLMLRVKMFAL